MNLAFNSLIPFKSPYFKLFQRKISLAEALLIVLREARGHSRQRVLVTKAQLMLPPLLLGHRRDVLHPVLGPSPLAPQPQAPAALVL